MVNELTQLLYHTRFLVVKKMNLSSFNLDLGIILILIYVLPKQVSGSWYVKNHVKISEIHLYDT
jgi:hypothetical protein